MKLSNYNVVPNQHWGHNIVINLCFISFYPQSPSYSSSSPLPFSWRGFQTHRHPLFLWDQISTRFEHPLLMMPVRATFPWQVGTLMWSSYAFILPQMQKREFLEKIIISKPYLGVGELAQWLTLTGLLDFLISHPSHEMVALSHL